MNVGRTTINAFRLDSVLIKRFKQLQDTQVGFLLPKQTIKENIDRNLPTVREYIEVAGHSIGFYRCYLCYMLDLRVYPPFPIGEVSVPTSTLCWFR